VVFPEPLIPANRITKGFFISNESFISSKKFGGLIRIDSIEFFSSFARSISFRDLPISFSSNEFLIDSTAPYATLFCRSIISSSSNISLNFSSVNFLWNFEKKPFSLIGVFIVSSRDCSKSVLGFSVLGDFFLASFSTVFSISFFWAFTFTFFIDFSISGSSLFLFIHFFSFSFSAPNIIFRREGCLKYF